MDVRIEEEKAPPSKTEDGAPKIILRLVIRATRPNPVNRGLGKYPQDWPWSSFLFHAKDRLGLLPIDPVD